MAASEPPGRVRQRPERWRPQCVPAAVCAGRRKITFVRFFAGRPWTSAPLLEGAVRPGPGPGRGAERDRGAGEVVGARGRGLRNGWSFTICGPVRYQRCGVVEKGRQCGQGGAVSARVAVRGCRVSRRRRLTLGRTAPPHLRDSGPRATRKQAFWPGSGTARRAQGPHCIRLRSAEQPAKAPFHISPDRTGPPAQSPLSCFGADHLERTRPERSPPPLSCDWSRE